MELTEEDYPCSIGTTRAINGDYRVFSFDSPTSILTFLKIPRILRNVSYDSEVLGSFEKKTGVASFLLYFRFSITDGNKPISVCGRNIAAVKAS